MTVTRSTSDWALQLAAVNRAFDERERVLLDELAESRSRSEQCQAELASLRAAAMSQAAGTETQQTLADQLTELKSLRQRCELLEVESSRANLLAETFNREAAQTQQDLQHKLAGATAELVTCRALHDNCQQECARLDDRCKALSEALYRESARSGESAQARDLAVRELAALAAGQSTLLNSLNDQQRERDTVLLNATGALEAQLRLTIAEQRTEIHRLRAEAASLELEKRRIRSSLWGRLTQFSSNSTGLERNRDEALDERTNPKVHDTQSGKTALPLAPEASFVALSMTKTAMTSTRPITEPARSAQELLSLQDESFVRTAYLSILRRQADPSGFEHFLAQVRQGVAKDAIVAELVRSPEGRSRPCELPGLNAVLRRNRRLGSLWERLARRMGVISGPPIAAQLRQIDNSIFRMAEANAVRFDRLESEVATIKHLLQLAGPSSGSGFATGPQVIGNRTSIVASKVVLQDESPRDVLNGLSKQIVGSEEALLLSR